MSFIFRYCHPCDNACMVVIQPMEAGDPDIVLKYHLSAT